MTTTEKFTPIKERWKYVTNKKISHTEVIRAVASHFNTEVYLITSEKRHGELCLCRAIACKILYRHSKITQEQLGELFNRDRTSVIHGIRVLTDWMEIYPEIRNHFETIEKSVLAYE